jgi:hypothetical protein
LKAGLLDFQSLLFHLLITPLSVVPGRSNERQYVRVRVTVRNERLAA